MTDGVLPMYIAATDLEFEIHVAAAIVDYWTFICSVGRMTELGTKEGQKLVAAHSEKGKQLKL